MSKTEQHTCPTCGQNTPGPVTEGKTYNFHGFTLETRDGVLFNPDRTKYVSLTRSETICMEALFLCKGRVASKGYIYDLMYFNAERESKIVDVFLCKIRAKFPPNFGLKILTSWGRGYLLALADAENEQVAEAS